MAGLGSVQDNNNTYLSVAGGYIWDRKAETSSPHYATQEFNRADGTTGTRAGARYGDLTGKIVDVVFKEHQEYGKNINVYVEANGEVYILSISTNNRYSQDMMKALLKCDLKQQIFIKPYDFVGDDKKRAQGISFRQGGQKINLRVDGSPSKEKDWFKTAAKRDIRRYFEDLADWFIGEVEQKVVPLLNGPTPKKEETSGLGSSSASEESQPQDEAPSIEDLPIKKPTSKKEPTVIQMKKALKEYIAENYGSDYQLPKLKRDQVKVWYDLSQNEEELPFDNLNDTSEASVPDSEVDAQLEALMD